jgi:hypothetical protein
MGLSRQDPRDLFVSPSFDPLLRARCKNFRPRQPENRIFRPRMPERSLSVAKPITYILDADHRRQFPATSLEGDSIYPLHDESALGCPGTRTKFIFRRRPALTRAGHVNAGSSTAYHVLRDDRARIASAELFQDHLSMFCTLLPHGCTHKCCTCPHGPCLQAQGLMH